MSRIVGTTSLDHHTTVLSALAVLDHTRSNNTRLVEQHNTILGQTWPAVRQHYYDCNENIAVVLDGEIWNWADLHPGATSPLEALAGAYARTGPEFVNDLQGHFALAVAGAEGLLLARDTIGVVPLYFHIDQDISFASEAKAMTLFDDDIYEFPPGHYYHPRTGFVQYAEIEPATPLSEPPEQIITCLRQRLVNAVARSITDTTTTGAWLSGGLDSSAIAALAIQQKGSLKTFVAGIAGAPDVSYARIAADYLGTEHYERICTPEELVSVIPEVVCQLESFDALLVRSSLTNYLAGQMAADHVAVVLSGEGGDELFAGYNYLEKLPAQNLADELITITQALHNTALQRVDRCSRAHGLKAHVPFLDDEVVAYALQIPTWYKLDPVVGREAKWILRRVMDGYLPTEIVSRPKAKFWEGAGVKEILSDYAERVISDNDFRIEQLLPDGTQVASKEELLYYRIFREHFSDDVDLRFVGRTPVTV